MSPSMLRTVRKPVCSREGKRGERTRRQIHVGTSCHFQIWSENASWLPRVHDEPTARVTA